MVARNGRDPVAVQAAVLTDPREATPVEWLLLAVKAHQTDGAAAWLQNLASERTTVVVLQNGVRRGDRVAAYVRSADIVPASISMPAEVTGSVATVRGEGRIRVPDDRGGRRFAELLAGSWLVVETVRDFDLEEWRKLTVNAVAGLMALAGRRAAMFREPDTFELARRYALECAAVARAEGVGLTDAAAVELAEALRTLPPDAGTSILFDRERRLALEWQARNGIIRDLGALHSVPTPISDVVVPLLAAASC
jgi:2-dehydropantoate 2-reductase